MTQRVCSNCGHPLSENTRTCPNCGHDVAAPAGAGLLATEALTASPDDEPEKERPTWNAWEGLAIFLIALIATLIVALPFGVALSPLKNCGSLPATQAATCLNHQDLFQALTLLFQELALGLTLVAWVKWVHKQGLRALAFRGFNAANVGIGVAVGLAGLLVVATLSVLQAAIIQSFTHKTVVVPKQISLQAHPQVLTLALIVIGVVFITPFAEEGFFRGFVFRRLAQRYKIGAAIVGSAAIFGLAHLIPLIMFPIFGLGILLASIVRRRNSLVPSIVAHMTFNGIQIAIFIAQKKY